MPMKRPGVADALVAQVPSGVSGHWNRQVGQANSAQLVERLVKVGHQRRELLSLIGGQLGGSAKMRFGPVVQPYGPSGFSRDLDARKLGKSLQ